MRIEANVSWWRESDLRGLRCFRWPSVHRRMSRTYSYEVCRKRCCQISGQSDAPLTILDLSNVRASSSKDVSRDAEPVLDDSCCTSVVRRKQELNGDPCESVSG